MSFKYEGANKQRQTELKRLHAAGKSAADASKATGVNKECVDKWFKHFDGPKKAETAAAKTAAK